VKKEIMARGPVACGMFVTNKFEKEYKAGMIWE
jgi:hypothetical protein